MLSALTLSFSLSIPFPHHPPPFRMRRRYSGRFKASSGECCDISLQEPPAAGEMEKAGVASASEAASFKNTWRGTRAREQAEKTAPCVSVCNLPAFPHFLPVLLSVT